MPTTVDQFDLFDADEVEQIVGRLFKIRNAWTIRGCGNERLAFTLGRAAYLDFCSGDQPERDYLIQAPIDNGQLMAEFGDMYDRVRRVFEVQLGSPVIYTEKFAIPGFHIFFGSAIASAASAPVHFDGQYQYLPWDSELDPVPPISFTLALRMPTVGAGLDVWHITPDDVQRAASFGMETELDRLKDRKLKSYYPYRLGSLTVHSGLLLHRIADLPGISDDDQRITLQGHGVRIHGTWHLHW